MNKPMILVGAGALLIFISLVLMGLGLGAVASLPFLIAGAVLAAVGGFMASRAQRKFMWSIQTRVGNLETRTQKTLKQVEDVRKAVGETRELAARSSEEELALIEGQVQQHEAQLREVGRLIAAGRAGEPLRQG